MEAVKTGQAVKVVDEFGNLHDGLVTNAWGEGQQNAINVVFVSDDSTKTDGYGRQIERKSSLCHRDNQAAPGNYWYVTGERKNREGREGGSA